MTESFEKNLPHTIQECVCLKCFHRFLDVRPEHVWLKELECPQCDKVGYIIATGQILPEDPYNINKT